MSSITNIPQSNHQLIINALTIYADRTSIDISTNPFAEKLQLSNSPDAILELLHDREKAFKEYREGNRKLINRLTPAVEVLHAFSGVLGEAISLVPFPPAKAIFVGIDALLAAASGVSSSYDALLDLFECIGNFLQRLAIYTKFPLTSEMTDIIVKIMAELLSVLALATKQIKDGRFKKFTKKLLGENDVESVLQRLDRLTQDEARMTVAQTFDIVYGLVGNMRVVMDDGKASIDGIRDALVAMHQMSSEMNKMKREQIQSHVQHWLSPPDPSTNHGFVSNARHTGSGAWFFNGSVLTAWKETGSLLWIHGKPGSGKSTLLSAIIQDIESMCEAGLATMVYYYFDFRDAEKQNRKGLLSSLLSQLCADSDAFCDILSRLRLSHASGARKPTDSALTKCLRDMLTFPRRGHIFIIVDAIDECPNTTGTHGTQTAREEVLDLIQEVIDWQIPNLYLCLTSRPEIDIRTVLEPITPLQISLHDEIGQKKDIIDYINATILSDRKMKKWRKEDQELVIDTLSEKADGMFRWVVCQIDRLRRSFPASIRSILNDLPKGLDETYEHMLSSIDDEKREYAQRLFRCLAVSIRPLRVEELADILAVKFDQGESPIFGADWRPPDAEEAVFSACSSLIAIVDVDGSQVVQFAHFSVKEFLTSNRLSSSNGPLSYYHIDPMASHIVVAHASLSLLLQLDDKITKDTMNDLPLALYAAQHWVDHAQVEGVSSHIQYQMERLFDSSQLHFDAWVWLHDIDHPWVEPMSEKHPRQPQASPLYYASVCGFHELVLHLAVTHPSDVRASGGSHKSPLHAAIIKGHLDVAKLLLIHGADANYSDDKGWTPLHLATRGGHLSIMRPLLEHGGYVESQTDECQTPLILASLVGNREVAGLLLDHGADLNTQDDEDRTPLVYASRYGHVDLVQLFLDRGADVGSVDTSRRTALHYSSSYGHLNVARMLVEHGADLNALDESHETPFDRATNEDRHEVAQFLLDRSALPGFSTKSDCSALHTASKSGHLDIVRSLLEHGEDINSQTTSQETPLILASGNGKLDVTQFLLENGADVDARDKHDWTALHVASRKGHRNVVHLLLDHGADINAKTADDRTSLDHASSKGAVEVVRLLIERGADLDCQADDDWTPLHRASNKGHIDVAKLLLEHGADTDLESITGRTPLDVASLAGEFEVVQILRAHWANMKLENIEDWTMVTAIRKGRSDIVGSFLERGEDFSPELSIVGERVPALHHASFTGFFDIAQLLLKWGADVDLRSEGGSSALHRAARSCHVDIANLLLEHRANINARDKDHDTPLHIASRFGHLEAVRFLLKRGADPHLQNNKGEMPFHAAAAGGYQDITRLLIAARGA